MYGHQVLVKIRLSLILTHPVRSIQATSAVDDNVLTFNMSTCRYVEDGFGEDLSHPSVVAASAAAAALVAPGLGKHESERIQARLLRPEWTANIMMRKLTGRLMSEAGEGHTKAARRAAVDYALMDPEEAARLNVRAPARARRDAPAAWRSTVRAPVPWHQGFVTARQFCRHNLFVTNPILLRIQIIWVKRYHDVDRLCSLVQYFSKCR